VVPYSILSTPKFIQFVSLLAAPALAGAAVTAPFPTVSKLILASSKHKGAA